MSKVQERSKQVTSLPIGSGGSDRTTKQLNDTNVSLTLMGIQASADSKYDGPIPSYTSSPAITSGFSSGSMPIEHALLVISGLLIVYGIIAK